MGKGLAGAGQPGFPVISIWKDLPDGFRPLDEPEQGCWIRAVDPNAEEQERLRSDFGVDPDFLNDVLDIDEQSRIERDDQGISVIIRIPLYLPEREVEYFTVPYGIIIRGDALITMCLYDNPISQDMQNRRIRGMDLSQANSIILHSILRSVQYYLRYLKDINRKTGTIERVLHKAVKNTELMELMTLQKSLVYFTTSLRANEMLLEKIHKLAAWQLSPDEQEILEDVFIDQKQAIEMARIYSNILTGMMNSFASVISNNLNAVMKRLTVISLMLMIPTLVASIYGMNVGLPFQDNPWAFPVVVGIALLVSSVVLIVFRWKKLY